MRLRRPLPNVRTRHALAVAVVFAQVVAATGAPVFAPRKSTTGAAVPYPCQSHACGCTASEPSWAGDCCCFTLEEKLAWAEARGIEPPEHVRPLVAERKAARKQKAKPSCCSEHEKPAEPSCCSASEPAETKCENGPPAPKLKWVAGVFAQKCRGDGPAGSLKVEAGFAPDPPYVPREPRPARDFAPPTNTPVRSASHQPPIPPPRAS